MSHQSAAPRHARRKTSGRPFSVQVFVDPSGRRRRLWGGVGVVVGCVQAAVLVALAGSLVADPEPDPPGGTLRIDTDPLVGQPGNPPTALSAPAAAGNRLATAAGWRRA